MDESTNIQAEKARPPRPLILVRAKRLLDVSAGQYLEHAEVLVEGDRIKNVRTSPDPGSAPQEEVRVIDLGDSTLLPGLIGCPTHLLGAIPEGPDGYRLNLLTQSEAFRALEGAANAKAALEAEFTSVRDVENESAGFADVAPRETIEKGLLEGPRMQVATRGIAVVGQYHPFGISPGLSDFPTGA
jgi:imidazolonepropionase-like amidohydrolase